MRQKSALNLNRAFITGNKLCLETMHLAWREFGLNLCLKVNEEQKKCLESMNNFCGSFFSRWNFV